MSNAIRFIKDIHEEKARAGRPVISFEFFPPKTPEGDRALLERTIPELLRHQPDYCSVTYGAGGSTRDKTLSIVSEIQNRHGLTAMSHLTCVNATRDEIRKVLEDAKARGIKNILALRGDPPGGEGEFQKTEGGFEYSYELVEFVKEMDCFSIGVAGFPEGHIACKEGKIVDWERLKKKIDRGADFVLTQLFFDNRDFFEFRDHVDKKLGNTVPIFPGVLPILSAGQIKRFTSMCGARLPEKLLARLDELKDDDAGAAEFGIEYATQQCSELLAADTPGLHFYTLNKPRSTGEVLRNLGLTPAASEPVG